MHESSLARQILKVVLERAERASAARVRAVRGWVAETEALSPRALAFHFSACARGTCAEDATLDLRLVHVRARCRACQAEYAPEHHLLLCPACGSSDGEQLGETGIRVEALEVD